MKTGVHAMNSTNRYCSVFSGQLVHLYDFLDVFTLAPPAFKYKTPIVCIRIFRRIHLIQGKPYE